tara:strand:- start:95 stop:340 length:246 start_codon:yes stop_codon:yes gene_type:complete
VVLVTFYDIFYRYALHKQLPYLIISNQTVEEVPGIVVYPGPLEFIRPQFEDLIDHGKRGCEGLEDLSIGDIYLNAVARDAL